MTLRARVALRAGILSCLLTSLSLPACSDKNSTTPYQTCIPGTQACAGDSVVTCAADGATFHDPVACPVTCTPTPTGATCDDIGAGGNGGGQGGSNGGGGDVSGGGSSGSENTAGTDSGGTSGAAGGGSGGSGGGSTGDPPAVLLLIDASSSAWDGQVSAAGTRWDAIRQSLSPSGNALAAFQDRVAFGAYRFNGTMEMCPNTTAIAPALNNYPAISTLIEETALIAASDTPLAETLTLAASSLASHSGDRYIIVITDGIPDTCAMNDGNCIIDAVLAAQQAHEGGVSTILVTLGAGFEFPTNNRFRQDFANAGAGEPIAEPDFEHANYNCGGEVPTYSANDGDAVFHAVADEEIQTELAGTLAQIVGGIVE